MVKTKSVKAAVDQIKAILDPYCVRVAVTGELRRKLVSVKVIPFLAVPKYRAEKNLLDQKLKLLQVSGEICREVEEGRGVYRVKDGALFKVSQVKSEAWVASLFQSSCEKDLYITVATAAKAFGKKWVPASGGFALVSGAIHLVKTEEEIFETVGLPYMAPKLRDYGPVFKDDGKNLPVFASKDEVRAWEKSKTWVDTWCGGEHHNYCFRTQDARQTPQQAEREFLRMIWTIRKYGYDGRYYGRMWRYLDLDGVRFFDNGWNPVSTWVLNRKPHIGRARPWEVNPVKWTDQGDDSHRPRASWQ